MRLGASEIQREIKGGRLVFDPPIPAEQIQASSVDLTLSDTLYVIERVFKEQEKAGVSSILDLRTYTWAKFITQFGSKMKIPPNGHFDIPTHTLVLGHTKELVRLPQHLGGRVEGKSGNARIGLFVHISSPTIHPGFNNQIALEFYNVGPIPIRVYPGQTICQLILEKVIGSGLYQGQFQKRN